MSARISGKRSGMTVLPRQGYRRMPWKNGGGITWEILREPADAEHYDWRLSMAEISAPGPFSDFSGYQRHLLLFEGPGLVLKAPGEADRTLARRGDLASFDGALPMQCELPGGPCTDLNLIVRADLPVRVNVVSLASTWRHVAGQGRTVLVALEASRLEILEGEPVELARGDTALVEPGVRVSAAANRSPEAALFVAVLGSREGR